MFPLVAEVLGLGVDLGGVVRDLKHHPLPVVDLHKQFQQTPTGGAEMLGGRLSIMTLRGGVTGHILGWSRGYAFKSSVLNSLILQAFSYVCLWWWSHKLVLRGWLIS